MGDNLGYARVSTKDQDPRLQHDALTGAGCVRIFTDKASGTLDRRPQLDRLLDQLRPGDVLVVWKLDRLGRSVRHLIDVVTGLAERGVAFRSLSEGFDTSTAGGRMIFQVLGALAEFERSIISERTTAGLDAARARGRKGGRRPKLSERQVAMVRQMHDSGEHTISAIAETFKVTRPTIYRVLEAERADAS